jgi:hypothetical protein
MAEANSELPGRRVSKRLLGEKPDLQVENVQGVPGGNRRVARCGMHSKAPRVNHFKRLPSDVVREILRIACTPERNR